MLNTVFEATDSRHSQFALNSTVRSIRMTVHVPASSAQPHEVSAPSTGAPADVLAPG